MLQNLEDLVVPSLAQILSEVVSCPAETEVVLNTRIRRRHPTQAGKMLEIDAIAGKLNDARPYHFPKPPRFRKVKQRTQDGHSFIR